MRSKRLLYLLVVISTTMIVAWCARWCGFRFFGLVPTSHAVEAQLPLGLGKPAKILLARPPAGSLYEWLVCCMAFDDAEYWAQKNEQAAVIGIRPESPTDLRHIGVFYKIRADSDELEPATLAEWLTGTPDARTHAFQSLPGAIQGDRVVAIADARKIESFGAFAGALVQVADTRIVTSYSSRKPVWSWTGWSTEFAGPTYYEVFLPPYTDRVGPAFRFAGLDKPHVGAWTWTPDGRLMIAADDKRAWVIRIDELQRLK